MMEAEVQLAELMLTGRGGPKDHPAALALFEKAAGRGHVGAMFAMGAMHGGGHEVPTDRPTAQRCFRAAAERGHPHAQMMLGRYLARGLAGERDPERARVWLERALAQGLQEARGDLAALPPAPAEPAEPAESVQTWITETAGVHAGIARARAGNAGSFGRTGNAATGGGQNAAGQTGIVRTGGRPNRRRPNRRCPNWRRLIRSRRPHNKQSHADRTG